MRVRILFAGTPETAVPSLLRLVEAGHDVVAVLTRAPARAGRSHKLRNSAVHDAAERLGIPVLTPASLRNAEIREQIVELAPQAVAVVAYGLIIPSELLDVPTHGWINLHFSLLPAWRGAAPVQYAIAAGDEITGASTFRIEKGLDTGPVFGMVTEQIKPTDTSGDLLERLAGSGAELLAQTFSLLESGQAVATAQQGVPSHAPTISTQAAKVNWQHPAVAIERHIRSLTPAPGAWTLLAGSRVKLGPVTQVPTVTDLGPGELREDLVGTGSHALRLGWVAPAGKKQMLATDWLRGARLEPGMSFDLEDAE